MRVSDTGEWQLRRCPAPGCSSTTLRLRRHQRTRDLWWVGRLDYNGPWLIAGSDPCCPQCRSGIDVGKSAEQQAR